MLAPLLALALAAAPKLAVLPVAAGEGVSPGTAAAVTEALTGEVRRRSGGDVITQREIGAVLSLERQKAMLGCQTESCMAELGGALGCDRLVVGDLARLGESWLVHLRVVEAGKARVAAQAGRRLRGGTIDDVLDALPAMVQELFPGGGGAPATRVAAAPAAVPAAVPVPAALPAARPVSPPWAEEPLELPPRERAKLAVWTDGKGRTLATEPFAGMDAPFWWGKGKKLFRVRTRSGGSEGNVAFSRVFWDPRARRPLESSLDVRDMKAVLTCGDQQIPLVRVPPRDVLRHLRQVTFHAPRWRRYPHALARDDEGNYFYVDGARTAEGEAAKTADHRLYLGKKGQLARVELTDALTDGGGLLFLAAPGRLEIRRGERGTEAAWVTAAGKKPLTWLEPSDHGPLLYGELGVYAGEELGTPCDGRL